jgi:hypothetical protein
MGSLNKVQRLILDAVSDDLEDLEQIYRSICLEFSPERYGSTDPNAFYWRESANRVRLEEVVDNLKALVDRGLLCVKLPDRDAPPDTASDLTYLWHGWFGLTPEGRAEVERDALAHTAAEPQ